MLYLRVRYCLSILVYAGLSLFIISGPYLYMVVCVLYAYNLTRGGGRGAGEWMASEKGSEGRQVSSCLFLKEMPLAVYQSRV